MAQSDYERINTLIKFLKCNNLKDFADKIGHSRNNIYDLKKKHRFITTGLAKKIKEVYPDISESWLVYGKGTITESSKDDQVHESAVHYGKCIHCDAMRDTIEAQKKLIKMLEDELACCKDDLEKRKAG